jgi:hypothetical protein
VAVGVGTGRFGTVGVAVGMGTLGTVGVGTAVGTCTGPRSWIAWTAAPRLGSDAAETEPPAGTSTWTFTTFPVTSVTRTLWSSAEAVLTRTPA